MKNCFSAFVSTLIALVSLSFLAVAAESPTAPGVARADRPPNVVLIFADDLGTLDLNCYGSKDLHTPHLDGLARRGVRFTQFYAASPVCSPSRGALITGRYPQRAGVPGNVGIGARGLPPEEVTIAELVAPSGYRRALIGKWHLGQVIEHGPLDQGFETFFGHKKGCIDNYSHFFYWSGPNVHDLWRDKVEHFEDGTHFGNLVVREATKFIENHKTEPFFLFLPLNIPHYPLQGLAHHRARYQSLPEPRRSYAALVSTMDEKVGEVLAKIDELGLRDSTLVIFMSDHGHSTEVRTMSGGGNAGPYRGVEVLIVRRRDSRAVDRVFSGADSPPVRSEINSEPRSTGFRRSRTTRGRACPIVDTTGKISPASSSATSLRRTRACTGSLGGKSACVTETGSSF